VSKYYCHSCAIKLKLLGNERTTSILGSTYQFDKYTKHTMPKSSYHLVSIFDNPSTALYAQYVVNAVFAGSVQIDDAGRKNITWVAGKKVGAVYVDGTMKLPANITLSVPHGTELADDDGAECFPLGLSPHAVYQPAMHAGDGLPPAIGPRGKKPPAGGRAGGVAFFPATRSRLKSCS
jgi:hypothetical protein